VVGAGSRDLLLNSATAYIPHERLRLAVCAVHSMQPSPHYLGLLLVCAAYFIIWFFFSVAVQLIVKTPLANAGVC